MRNTQCEHQELLQNRFGLRQKLFLNKPFYFCQKFGVQNLNLQKELNVEIFFKNYSSKPYFI